MSNHTDGLRFALFLLFLFIFSVCYALFAIVRSIICLFIASTTTANINAFTNTYKCRTTTTYNILCMCKKLINNKRIYTYIHIYRSLRRLKCAVAVSTRIRFVGSGSGEERRQNPGQGCLSNWAGGRSYGRWQCREVCRASQRDRGGISCACCKASPCCFCNLRIFASFCCCARVLFELAAGASSAIARVFTLF